MGKAYSVERSITINAPADQVYGHVIDLQQWNHWSPWADMDPEMDQQFAGPDRGPGQSMSWSGNRKVGEGSMTITDAEPNERVSLDLAFLKPFKAKNTVDVHLVPDGDSTHVQWVMRGELSFIMQAMTKATSMDDMVGPDFERGLANLKRVAE